MVSEAFCEISGKVQAVGFRAYAEHEAKQCGVTGWVRNTEDGRVEVLVQGIPEHIKYFIEVLNEGSVLAVVENISVDWRSPQQLFTDFVVKY